MKAYLTRLVGVVKTVLMWTAISFAVGAGAVALIYMGVKVQ